MNSKETNSFKIASTEMNIMSFLRENRNLTYLYQIFEGISPEARITKLKEAVDLFFESFPRELFPEEKISTILKQIDSCIDIENFKDFAIKINSIIQPIFRLKNLYSLQYEKATSRVENKIAGYIELNRFVTYKKKGDTIYLHHSNAKEFVKAKGSNPSLYTQAMQDLADIIQNDPEIKKVEATSWIVYKMRRLFEKKGFLVKELPIESFSLQKISGNMNDLSNRKVATASIESNFYKFLERNHSIIKFMDPRLELLKEMMNIEKVPIGTQITLNIKEFSKKYPDFVKEAMGKIRVPLDPEEPEFVGKSESLVKLEGFNPLNKNPHTYKVRVRDFLSALKKVDPKAAEWWQVLLNKSGYDVVHLVLRNNEVEAIVD